MATVEKRQLEQEIEDASLTLDRLRAETGTFNPEAEARQLKQIEERRKELVRTIEGLNQARKELEKKIHALDTEEVKKKAIHARIEGFNGSCPVFLEIHSVSKGAPVECKTSDLLKAISRIRKASQVEIAEIRAERNTLQQKLVETSGLIGKSEKEIQQIDSQVSDSRLRTKRHEEAISRIRELDARKTKAEGILAGLDQGKIDESKRIEGEVNRLLGELERKRNLLAHMEQAEKKAALEKRLDVLEVLTLAFSPKGIMADLLSSAVKSLNDSLSRAMESISGGKYSMEMYVNEDVDVFLIDHGRGTRTGIRLASASERFRAGIVLQSVLSKLTGLRFMLIDGLDILDQENRGFFFNFIQEAKAGFDSLLVFSTIGQYYPTNPGIPDTDFWVIEAGTVKRIEP
jgi:DNA repair exonuclease SbcCD ATPase subunit